jgi:tetratricopeptide (TPR) repeat protein
MSHSTATRNWARLFEETAHRKFPSRIKDAVADSGRFADPAELPEFVTLLSAGLLVGAHADTALLAALAHRSMTTMLTVGPGPDFRDHEELLSTAVRLIDTIGGRDERTTQLYLLAAQFRAGYANTDAVRHGYIERAVSTAQDDRELASAMLFLARFHTDLSNYPKALAVLDRCRPLVAQTTLSDLRPEWNAACGLAHYYNEPPTARRFFEEATRLGRDHPDSTSARRAVGNALHFLGRLAADDGEYHRALTLYTEASRLSSEFKTGHGYYHQRVAEVLVDHGDLGEARYHLEAAEELFKAVGQVSNGLQLLQGTWARWHLRAGQVDDAVRSLSQAIASSRSERAARVELILLAEMLRVSLRQRKFLAVVAVLSRAGRVYLTAEAIRSPRDFIRQTVAVADRANNFLRVKKAPASAGKTNPGPVRCPCGAEHAQAIRRA